MSSRGSMDPGSRGIAQPLAVGSQWLFSSLAVLLAGCAALIVDTPPFVTISELTVVSAGLLEQQYDITLRIQNPNPSPLQIDGVVFEVELNDRPFAKGVGGQPVTVPRFGSEFMRVEAVSTLAGILKQIAELSSSQDPNLRYRIKGKLSVKDSLFRIPFDERGEINLGSLQPEE